MNYSVLQFSTFLCMLIVMPHLQSHSLSLQHSNAVVVTSPRNVQKRSSEEDVEKNIPRGLMTSPHIMGWSKDTDVWQIILAESCCPMCLDAWEELSLSHLQCGIVFLKLSSLTYLLLVHLIIGLNLLCTCSDTLVIFWCYSDQLNIYFKHLLNK